MKLITFHGSTFTKADSNEQPYGICLSWPEKFFAEYPGGEDQARRTLEAIGESAVDYWLNTIATFPKQEVGYCYLVFLGRVQYRMSIMGYAAGDCSFPKAGGGTRDFPGKKWIQLCGPTVKAPGEFLMRGFRGFRYCSFIF